MHALSFLQKRTHLCAVAWGRAMFAGIKDMTPARFDLLYLMRNGLVRQATITARLGLARQTVWEMVERLVFLGWIEKTKSGRRNCLRLTEEGMRRIRAAMGAAFSERNVLPEAAPITEAIPRWWRRRELADPMPPAMLAALNAEPKPKLPPAVDAAFDARTPTWEQLTRAKAAAASWDVDKALAQAKAETERKRRRILRAWPPKVGREVEKIYTSLAWKRCGARGRRKKRGAYMIKLMDFVERAEDMARALGNTTANIYKVRFIESFDH